MKTHFGMIVETTVYDVEVDLPDDAEVENGAINDAMQKAHANGLSRLRHKTTGNHPLGIAIGKLDVKVATQITTDDANQ